MNNPYSKRTNFIHNLPLLCWPTLLLVCISWIPYLRTMSHVLSFGDEGLVAQSAYRIYQGQVPFKDFFTAIVPGAYYFYALLFKLFEPSFLVMRIGVMFVSLLLLLSVWHVLTKFRITSFLPYFFSAAFLAFFGGPSWFIASHHWLSAMLCIFSLAFLLPDADSDSPTVNSSLIAGLLSALAAMTLQHRGALFIIGAVAALFMLPAEKRRSIFLAYLCGIALTVIPTALYLLYHAGFDTLFYDLITFPAQQYNKLKGHRGTSLNEISELLQQVSSAYDYRHQPLGLLRLAAWSLCVIAIIIIYMLPFAGCLLLWKLFKSNLFSRYQAACLGGFFFSSYLATLHRLSASTLIFASTASLIIAAVLFDSLKPSRSFTRAIQYSWIFHFTMLAACYSLFNWWSPKTSIKTPAGIVQVHYQGEADTMQGIAAFAAQNFSKSGDFFCYPYGALFYFLYKSDNQTPFDTLTWPMHTREQMVLVQKRLMEIRCRWIILTNPELTDSSEFYEFIKQNYVLRKKLKYAAIMELRQ